MQKYGEAAVLEMTLTALPKAAESVVAPLSNVDSITMYGDGNSTKLVQEMITNMTQAISGIKESTGLDVPQLLTGFLSGKAVGKLSNNQINND